MSASNLVFIGFMGSGKSSVAKALAKKSEYYFLDTDAMIESSEGRSISSIFADEGEAYFRCLEEETVKWLNSNVSSALISTGGGMLVHCAKLQEVGKIIYLKVPFLSILERMSKKELEKRPLFKDKEKAEAMYISRDKIYESKADVIIDANQPLEEVLKLVEQAVF